MEGSILSLIHFGGTAFIGVAVVGIITSVFQFAFRHMRLTDTLRVFIHFVFIPIGAMFYTAKLTPSYNYLSVHGMTKLFVGFSLLAVACSGLIVGSLELSDLLPGDKQSLFGRMIIYAISLVAGLIITPFVFTE
jgi:hypothetical protein